MKSICALMNLSVYCVNTTSITRVCKSIIQSLGLSANKTMPFPMITIEIKTIQQIENKEYLLEIGHYYEHVGHEVSRLSRLIRKIEYKLDKI